jgi:23S rRNA (cytidine1920-2'-O)/16S rRNA (cytidine1409-2'-O)-methyltransferase
LVHLQANAHAPGIVSPEIDSPQIVKEAYLQLKSKSISISDK